MEITNIKEITLYDKHRLLRHYIGKHGKSFHKKHGNWIKLQLFKDYYLSMDTWNGYISLCKGPGEYNEWTGFGRLCFGEPEREGTDKRICFLGGFINNKVDPRPNREETLDFINLQVLGLKYYESKEGI